MQIFGGREGTQRWIDHIIFAKESIFYRSCGQLLQRTSLYSLLLCHLIVIELCNIECCKLQKLRHAVHAAITECSCVTGVVLHQPCKKSKYNARLSALPSSVTSTY
jgi:hypothetical protein